MRLRIIILLCWCVCFVNAQNATNTPLPHLLPDSVYIQRLQKLPFVVEVPYNDIVRQYILRYVEHNPKQVAQWQSKGEYYFPIFRDIFVQYNLPYELCYLAVIESSLNATARSHRGAAGLWQFMPSTGNKYGLEINSLVDERMDVVRSTEAVCKYISFLYQLYKDWALVIAAYNCGSGNVNKAIQRAGKRDFWSIYPFLPTETRSYMPIFVAASYAICYGKEHGITAAPPYIATPTDTIHTTHRLHFEQIANIIHVPLEQLRQLNPQYIHDILPGGKEYAICLPEDKIHDFILKEDSIYAYKANEILSNQVDIGNGGNLYKIKSGDTLSGIAKQFHCSVKQLKQWNNLSSDAIRVGRTLKIRQ